MIDDIQRLVLLYLESLPDGQYDENTHTGTPQSIARKILTSSGGMLKGFVPWLREQQETTTEKQIKQIINGAFTCKVCGASDWICLSCGDECGTDHEDER